MAFYHNSRHQNSSYSSNPPAHLSKPVAPHLINGHLESQMVDNAHPTFFLCLARRIGVRQRFTVHPSSAVFAKYFLAILKASVGNDSANSPMPYSMYSMSR